MKEEPQGPPRKAVTANLRVRYAETDAMGIVHHGSYVVWMELGRTEFMRAHGFTYRELEKMGVLLPVLEIGVRYRGAAYYDDELRISTWVEELSRTRIRMVYCIERVADGSVLTEAFSLHTYAGRDGRPIRITHHPEVWDKLRGMAPEGMLSN